MFNEIQKQGGGEIIYPEKGRTYNHSINKLAFIFQKISCDCIKQQCKTNGTIKR